MKWTGKKVGLALCGGGVRGFSHIGVLNVLEQEGIAVDLIVGTSAGALEASELANADVIIRPQVGNLHWMDYARAGYLVKAGEQAARESLKKIRASLPVYRRIARFAGRLFRK